MRVKLLLPLALVLTTCTLGRAQAPPPAAPSATPSPDLAGIAHIALRVADLQTSLAFYNSLGFETPFQLSRDGKVYEAFVKINDRQFIELYPPTAKDTQVGFLHICFEGKDLAAARAFYVDRGLAPTAVAKAGAGNLLSVIRGLPTPTGPQVIEYTQYLPGSMHSKDIGQHLGPHRIGTELLSVSLPFDDPAAARAYYLKQEGFVVKTGSELAIPGDTHETVTLTSAKDQGFSARFTLRVDSLAAAKAQLREAKLPVSEAKGVLTLNDPDGNQISLVARP